MPTGKRAGIACSRRSRSGGFSAAADQPLKAMILLGINCGFGNHDCGTLPKSAVNLKTGWVSFPRPKTAIERRCPLWPETIKAIREAMAQRPKAKQREHDDLVFVTKYGQPWSKDTSTNPVSQEFRKLMDAIDREAAKAAKTTEIETTENLSLRSGILRPAAHLRNNRWRIARPSRRQPYHGPRRLRAWLASTESGSAMNSCRRS